MFVLIPVGLLVLALFVAMAWRVVVPTNEVHVVQRRKTSTAYGRNLEAGNVYYKIPASLPYFGVRVTEVPIDIFGINLQGYEAYDKNRVPFQVDVTAFFQIEDAVISSQRMDSYEKITEQLTKTLQGAVRKVLAIHTVDEIMGTRAELSAAFLAEVQAQVQDWGVKANSTEFMHIEDANDTSVITDIMNKERSTIEKESRVRVAENQRDAKVAEIEAEQVASLKDVERRRVVAVEQEKAQQTQLEQAAETKRKTMAVLEVETVRKQEIERKQHVIAAEAQADVAKAHAEGEAEALRRNALGVKDSKVLEGEGEAQRVSLTGKAEADVVRAKGLAQAEATEKNAEALAKLNEAGQMVEKLKATVAIETAKYSALGRALEKADVKIVTSGQGANFMGIPLNAETGANLDVFAKEAGFKNVSDAIETMSKKAGGVVKNVLGKGE